MSEIQPALTPEEWEYFLAGYPAVIDEVASDHYHEAAAQALHGQPFGFTWADVDELRAVAEQLPTKDVPDEALSNLADRIAALLPPREP